MDRGGLGRHGPPQGRDPPGSRPRSAPPLLGRGGPAGTEAARAGVRVSPISCDWHARPDRPPGVPGRSCCGSGTLGGGRGRRGRSLAGPGPTTPPPGQRRQDAAGAATDRRRDASPDARPFAARFGGSLTIRWSAPVPRTAAGVGVMRSAPFRGRGSPASARPKES